MKTKGKPRLKMSRQGFTAISVNAEMVDALNDVAVELAALTGINVTRMQAIHYLIRFWKTNRHKCLPQQSS